MVSGWLLTATIIGCVCSYEKEIFVGATATSSRGIRRGDVELSILGFWVRELRLVT